VQNCRINPDFDLFLQRKSGGPSPHAVDRASVAGPRVHCGPHSGRRPELIRARPSWRSGARRLAAEAPKARGRCGDPSGGLTLGEEAARWASGGGEQNTAVALGVRGARGEESWGRGVERWRQGLRYIGSGGTAIQVGNGRWRCGLMAVSQEASYRGG
jgi:hypothetical protein